MVAGVIGRTSLAAATFDRMFDEFVAAAAGASGAGGVGAWARVENAACARRLSMTADVLQARLGADGSAEREQWCVDNWDAVAAEVAAAQDVSLGVASHQLLIAMALRERLPRVGEVFATGQMSLRVVNAVVYRSGLVRDPAALAKVDTELATAVVGWGSLSMTKVEAAIDYWVDRYDPDAVRRVEASARGRYVDIVHDPSGSGRATVNAQLFGHDGDALDRRLEAMASEVCDADPRSVAQRRSDALGAFGHGADRLTCLCGHPDCDAAEATPTAVIINVIAAEKSLSDDTPAQLDGASPPGPTAAQLREMTIAQALAQPPGAGPANTNPAVVMGGGLLPAPLLAAKLATTATIRPVIHPGESAPEPRYTPSAGLARFVRCRDLTCRFPGCDEPADRCDLDHTIAYPVGPTCASNLKCLCRKHHLLKTFCGWRDQQLPGGTLLWTSPTGQSYTTDPGSRLLFPSLCKPTAPVSARTELAGVQANRRLMMPRRKSTRAHDRAKRIDAERARNRAIRENLETTMDGDGPENIWEDAYFPSRPPPVDTDPPRF
jgi:hypothetical protein